MKIVWEIADIKAGTKVKKPLGDSRFAYFIMAHYFDAPGGTINGIFDESDGEFIRVGNGSQEALVAHLNICGFLPVKE